MHLSYNLSYFTCSVCKVLLVLWNSDLGNRLGLAVLSLRSSSNFRKIMKKDLIFNLLYDRTKFLEQVLA